MIQVGLFPAEDIVLPTNYWTFGRSRALRRKEKGFVWSKDVTEKFTSLGKADLDTFTNVFDVVKACMLLPKHSRFVGREINTVCFKESILGVVNMFVRQVLNEESSVVARKICRLQKRSLCLLLAVSDLEGRNHYQMPCTGCVLHSHLPPTLWIFSPTGSETAC